MIDSQLNLEIAALREAYLSRRCTPEQVVDAVLRKFPGRNFNKCITAAQGPISSAAAGKGDGVVVVRGAHGGQLRAGQRDHAEAMGGGGKGMGEWSVRHVFHFRTRVR